MELDLHNDIREWIAEQGIAGLVKQTNKQKTLLSVLQIWDPKIK